MGFLIYVICYAMGSLPFGFLISKFKGIDITKAGSGNVGATNVARNLGWKLGALVLVLDSLKGFLAVKLAEYWNGDINVAGFVAILGHILSIPFVFKGGKGVATYLGVNLALNPLLGLAFVVAFFILFQITRIVSLSCLVGIWIVNFSVFINQSNYVPLVTALVITVAHTSNIRRLIRGEEPKFKLN
ncbi:MAG: glycerol-3-phosphate 1-O-acyltransferase PlsY [Deltaproteobacteria bacterium]|nr:glycerol-3-phosphate 1-O-acyltransferase PlsY [Deltaproteobacteria bacterium]